MDYAMLSVFTLMFHHAFPYSLLKFMNNSCRFCQFERKVKAADFNIAARPPPPLLPYWSLVFMSHIYSLLDHRPSSSSVQLLLQFHTYCRSHILTTPISYFILSIWLHATQNNVLAVSQLMCYAAQSALQASAWSLLTAGSMVARAFIHLRCWFGVYIVHIYLWCHFAVTTKGGNGCSHLKSQAGTVIN